MKYVLAVAWMCLLIGSASHPAKGQADVPSLRKNVYLELVGSSGYLYSINGEMARPGGWAGRVGFTYGDLLGNRLVSFPASIIRLYALQGGHYFEVGVGGTPGSHVVERESSEDRETFFLVSGIAGFRYQAEGKGLLIRLALMPSVSVVGSPNFEIGNNGFGILPGFAAGYSF